ncbi:MAG TPA: ribonuclease R [Kiritimatiellia bacterium]
MPHGTSSLEKRLLDFLSAPSYRPSKQHELARALGLKKNSDLRAALRELERRGQVVCLRKNRWGVPRPSEQTVGKLSVHPQGFGFVTREGVTGPDVFIERGCLGPALHGDRVTVALKGRPGKDGKVEGRVTGVVERGRSSVVGLLKNERHGWYIVPDNPRLQHNVTITEFAPSVSKPHDGHKVVVALDPWIEGAQQISGRVVEDLGEADAPGVDVLSIMRDRDIVAEFDDKVIAEAKRQAPLLTPSDLEGRRDLRQEPVATIDPEDAKDFDDAVSLVALGKNHWRLDVHIADVSHYVRTGTEVDREARRRGNSIYMVDRFVPMLPHYLTGEVCSLKPNIDRLAHTVRLELDDAGEVLKTESFPSVIHSKARLNYDQVQAFMEGGDGAAIPAQLHGMVRDMDKLARRLRKRRAKNGSIELAMPEVKCVLDDQGRPVRIFKRGSDDAYHLIEEFMLLANCAVAEILHGRECPALYRIHPPPSEEQWAQIVADLQNLGIREAPETREDLNRIAGSLSGTPLEYAGNLAILRNLKRASYSNELEEHFGLAFEKYAHFTSPIRRYPDLIVHRQLKAVEANRPRPYSEEDLAGLGAHCSQAERNAADAEEESLKIKRLEYYAAQLERREIGPYQALVVDVIGRGLIVEVIETLQRGLVAFAGMSDDFYSADPARRRATGRSRKNIIRVGQVFDVELARVDMTRRQVDFRIAVAHPLKRGRKGKRTTNRHE